MECEIPAVNADTETIRKIFNTTKTVAVIGASPNPQKDSHKVAKYLLEAGFEMIPIYPKGEKILNQKVYRTLLDIQETVDMVVVFRKPQAVDKITAECIQRGDVKTLWLQVGIVNNSAAQKAKDAGIEVVQNLCAMVEHRNM